MQSQLYETLVMLTSFIPESNTVMDAEEAGTSMGTILRLRELDTIEHTKEHAILGYLIGCYNRARIQTSNEVCFSLSIYSVSPFQKVENQEVGKIALSIISKVAVGFLRGLLPKNDGNLARVSLTKRIYYDTVPDPFLLSLIEIASNQGVGSLSEVHSYFIL